MPEPSPDADAALAAAAAHLTETVALQLPAEALPEFKSALRRLFAGGLDTEAAVRLSDLVSPHLDEGTSWEVALPDGRTIRHGVDGGVYRIEILGDRPEADLFRRAFRGPVVPEATPHPAKVRFTFGGDPAPGVWFTRDRRPSDHRARRLLDESVVSDVMVAGHFVTIGLVPGERWAAHLDRLLELVTDLFVAGAPPPEPSTRDEMLTAASAEAAAGDDLHLTDPDAGDGRRRLEDALESGATAQRKVAVAVLAQSEDPLVAESAIRAGFADRSPAVRRVAVDAARTESLRDLLESALAGGDAWLRWRALRNLAEIGAGPSRRSIADLAGDPDFQVRLEVARIMAEEGRER